MNALLQLVLANVPRCEPYSPPGAEDVRPGEDTVFRLCPRCLPEPIGSGFMEIYNGRTEIINEMFAAFAAGKLGIVHLDLPILAGVSPREFMADCFANSVAMCWSGMGDEWTVHRAPPLVEGEDYCWGMDRETGVCANYLLPLEDEVAARVQVV